MRMYNTLLALFRTANIVALVLTFVSCILTVVAKIRKGKLASATIVFPVFSEQHTAIKYCFWSGTAFVFLNWLLCSSSALSLKATQNGGTSNSLYSSIGSAKATAVNPLSENVLTFAILWAVVILVCALTEVVLKCIKSTEKSDYSVIDGVKSAFGYSVLYMVFSFLIA